MKLLIATTTVALVLTLAAAMHPGDLMTHHGLVTREFAVNGREGASLEGAHSQVGAGLASLVARWPAMHSQVSTRAIGAECQAAGEALGTIISSSDCSPVFSDDPSQTIWENRDVTTLTPQIEAYCTSTCRTEVGPAFRTLLQTCSRDEIAEYGLTVQDVINVRVAIRLPCFEHNGEYCFPVAAAFNDVNFDDGVTVAELDTACSPCMRKYIAVFLAMQASSAEHVRAFAAQYEFLCSRSKPQNGVYCIKEFERIGGLGEISPQEAFTEHCSTNCIARLGMIARAYNQSFGDTDFRQTQALCYRDADDNLCSVRVFDWMAANGGACPDTTCSGCDAETGDGCENPQAPYCAGDQGGRAQRAQGYCNATMCGGVMDSFIGATDCCANFLLGVTPFDERAEFEAWVTDAAPRGCGRQFPSPCPGFNMGLRIRLSNLRAAWVTSSIALLREAILIDIAANTGFDTTDFASDVNLLEVDASTTTRSRSLLAPSTWFSTRAGETDVLVTLNLDTPSAADAIAVSESIAAYSFVAPRTTGLGEGAIANQDEGVSVTVEATDCDGCADQNAATSAAPAAPVLAAPLLALLAAALVFLTL